MATSKKEKTNKVESNANIVVSSSLKNTDVSPQKLRLIADLIRGKSVVDSLNILQFTNKKGAANILKLLNAAIANAENNFNLDGKSLYVKTIYVDEGMKLPRYRFASRGRVNKLVKRRSHAVIELSSKNN